MSEDVRSFGERVLDFREALARAILETDPGSDSRDAAIYAMVSLYCELGVSQEATDEEILGLVQRTLPRARAYCAAAMEEIGKVS